MGGSTDEETLADQHERAIHALEAIAEGVTFVLQMFKASHCTVPQCYDERFSDSKLCHHHHHKKS